MRVLSRRPRRGLVVYQLVLILLAVVILILVLLFLARRDQPAAATPADTAPSLGVLSYTGDSAQGEWLVT